MISICITKFVLLILTFSAPLISYCQHVKRPFSVDRREYLGARFLGTVNNKLTNIWIDEVLTLAFFFFFFFYSHNFH
jgi:hypothetical protein